MGALCCVIDRDYNNPVVFLPWGLTLLLALMGVAPLTNGEQSKCENDDNEHHRQADCKPGAGHT